MARLTKAIKSKVLESIILAANEPQSALLITQEHALADLIYKNMIGHDLHGLQLLPASYFESRTHLTPYVENEFLTKKEKGMCPHMKSDLSYQSVQTNIINKYDDAGSSRWSVGYIWINNDESNRSCDQIINFAGDDDRVVPHFMAYRFELPKKLHKRFIDQVIINYKHINSLRALRDKTCQLLDSVTTTDKLIKLWPDVVDHLPEVAGKVSLPAIQVKDVIALIKCTQQAACSVAQRAGKGTVIAL